MHFGERHLNRSRTQNSLPSLVIVKTQAQGSRLTIKTRSLMIPADLAISSYATGRLPGGAFHVRTGFRNLNTPSMPCLTSFLKTSC
jgi:hypothetical protein